MLGQRFQRTRRSNFLDGVGADALPVDEAGRLPFRRHPNGTIVHWPSKIKAAGEIREQFHHVIDVAATVLEVAGLPEPSMVNGVRLQKPLEGLSMAYSFGDAAAADRHATQYFEMVGNRGIYHKGWTAVTKHCTPWETGAIKLAAFDDDVWELFDTRTDWTQAHDLAQENPKSCTSCSDSGSSRR